MQAPFDTRSRDLIARLCQAFERAEPVLESTALKRAAVALTLVPTEAGEVGFVLTRRTPKLRTHSGQWALPGGRVDPGESADGAALRELDEEVGLRLPASAIIGRLDDYATRSGYLISPIVVWAEEAGRMQPNPDEVASVHRIALTVIAAPDAVEFVEIPESDRRVVRVLIDDRRIHAPTGAFLYQFRELLAGRTTRVFDLEQPTFAWK
ncbi:MAG: CoA pyrophosphatase [Burkholderiaceae bacterium]|nr:CoA pyrophosphatase [Burkholderiaceae bacterium]